MATFITLMKYTTQGIANIKESPARLDAAREAFAGMGVTIKDFYLTMGEYDGLIVVEAPDAATAAKALLATGAQGNVGTTTMAALNESEFREVVAGLP
jgi:uncharacterized protein with GYD domain